MTAILTNSFRIKQAQLFLEAFVDAVDKNIYLGLGRPNPWADDLIPEIPVDDVTTIGNCYSTLLALKKLSLTDIINVVPRFNWETNTVYVAYSNNDANLFVHPTSEEIAANNLLGYKSGSFYVLTDTYNVYKCLKAGPGPSTIQPDLTITNSFETADGYTWKFLFPVLPAIVEKFLSDAWLPVKLLLSDNGSSQWDVQQAAIPGTIDNVDIIEGGSGYTKLFDGAVSTGTLTTVTFTPGVLVGDLTGETVLIDSGQCAGQFRKILSYNIPSRIATVAAWDGGVLFPNGGSTYKIIPTVTLTGDGEDFSAYAEITAGTVTNIVVDNIGEGYTFGTIALSSGTGYEFNAAVSPLSGHGGNPVTELGGSYIMIANTIEYNEESDIITDNDYRRLLLITNVLTSGSVIATAPTLNALKSITYSGLLGAFVQDELVNVSNGAQFQIVSIDEDNDKLYYIQHSGTGVSSFTNAHTIVGLTSGATADIDSVNTSEIQDSSGEIIYIKNLRPVLRNPSLIEDIKILIKF